MHGADIRGDTGHETPPEELDEAPDLGQFRTRLVWILSALLLVLLLAFVPPLINVSRFQRRIASNLSASLGRPVHLDRVALTLLPLPGFTLENFVVDEDPSFGYEPILRANEVRATVRISSLWSHHVEFSRISLTEPTSLNLVRLPDGRWNFEPVLLQASRIEAAPTAQAHSGSVPRFPYIEASGARINLKLAAEKTPFALTDSEFSLWLPSARQWHFRLQAHPARTDVAPSDGGVLRLDGTLGDATSRASTLAQVPMDLHVLWDPAPLAGLSRIAFGRDIGLRGDLSLNVHALGTLGNAKVLANLKLARVRRADFVPARLVALDASCQATEANTFQSFLDVACRWPTDFTPGQPSLSADASIPDVRHPETASAALTLTAVPAAMVLDWIQAATPHAPTSLSGPGELTGRVSWNPAAQPAWAGEFALRHESLSLPRQGSLTPAQLGDITLKSPSPTPPPQHGRHPRPALTQSNVSPKTPSFDLSPVELPLGGHQPAILEGHFDTSGYTLRLTGQALPARLLALADSFPQFGEGLRDLLVPRTAASRPAELINRQQLSAQPEPAVHIDLTATRSWGHAQHWHDNSGTILAAHLEAR